MCNRKSRQYELDKTENERLDQFVSVDTSRDGTTSHLGILIIDIFNDLSLMPYGGYRDVNLFVARLYRIRFANVSSGNHDRCGRTDGENNNKPHAVGMTPALGRSALHSSWFAAHPCYPCRYRYVYFNLSAFVYSITAEGKYRERVRDSSVDKDHTCAMRNTLESDATSR
ncbi:hypothetical protein EVAR_102720_1 [Eumeta japonica]|uniref:Uncharacterized protein n=1 Tax=Eumeta variegata TaxID=151549 RepID=A0A4C1TIM4_EUMVA|nr:hypothetical protein EVAR_102720_1 [Eumeta japonica]